MESRSKMISIRLTPSEFDSLKELCKARGCTMTDLLVSTLGVNHKDAPRPPQFARR